LSSLFPVFFFFFFLKTETEILIDKWLLNNRFDALIQPMVGEQKIQVHKQERTRKTTSKKNNLRIVVL